MNMKCSNLSDVPSHRFLSVLVLLLAGSLFLLGNNAQAQDHDRRPRGDGHGMNHGRPGPGPGPGPGAHHGPAPNPHGQPYFPHGHTVPHIPHGAYEIHHGGHAYWYHGGQWYRPHGGLSIIVGAPIGAYVPVLPPYYSTIWWRGLPYYYADNSYYSWDSRVRKYVVVSPPVGIETAGTTAAVPEQIYIYPRNGQSEEQQEADRFECHRFAVQETFYDPTLPNGGVAPDLVTAKRAEYLRAQSACLEGRGYAVK